MTRHIIEGTLEISGQRFQVRRGQESFEATGAPGHHHVTKQRTIHFLPEVSIQAGDWLKPLDGGEEFHVLASAPEMVMGEPLATVAEVETTREYRARAEPKEPAPSVSMNFNAPIHGSNIAGTQYQPNITIHATISALEQEVNQRGGPDATELYEMLEAIRATLDHEKASRGAWAKFGDLMRRNPWIVPEIGKLALEWFAKHLPK